MIRPSRMLQRLRLLKAISRVSGAEGDRYVASAPGRLYAFRLLQDPSFSTTPVKVIYAFSPVGGKDQARLIAARCGGGISI
ncbi:hypothetical protein [Infirmifilum sp. SLHALR2]